MQNMPSRTLGTAELLSDEEELDQLVTALLTASRALVGVSARSLVDVEETVTVTQFRTLVVLRAHGVSRLNRLSDRLQVNASTALRTVERLMAVGLVDRRENPDDRREVVIELTDRGRQLVDEVTARRRRAIEAIVRSMPVEQRAAMVEALLAFAEAADEPLVVGDSATSLGW
jgi:DNA-binding MarR family transcriptional regulator